MRLDTLPKIIGKLMRASAAHRLRAALLRYGVLAGTEHRQVFADDLKTIIDIGANRGQFALAARHRLPRAKIISFEPQKAPAAIYRSLFADDDNALLYQAAIGPADEQRQMHISGKDDSSSLLQISAIQKSHFCGTEAIAAAEVQVSPLSRFVTAEQLARPALLKLDVQGFEYEALLGCESLLGSFDLIYCECSFVEFYVGQKLAAQIIAWLASRGFELVGFYNVEHNREGRALQADFLFRPRADGG